MHLFKMCLLQSPNEQGFFHFYFLILLVLITTSKKGEMFSNTLHLFPFSKCNVKVSCYKPILPSTKSNRPLLYGKPVQWSSEESICLTSGLQVWFLAWSFQRQWKLLAITSLPVTYFSWLDLLVCSGTGRLWVRSLARSHQRLLEYSNLYSLLESVSALTLVGFRFDPWQGQTKYYLHDIQYSWLDLGTKNLKLNDLGTKSFNFVISFGFIIIYQA